MLKRIDENSAMSRKRKPLSQLPLTNDSQSVPKKQRQQEPQKRAGSINKMILKNFMCHSLLEVDFSTSNISVIIGRNGSGKSAILTALVVGLGGKASLTNRGTSIKGFIKAGKNSGSVEIEIHNGGHMAYRPNIYGNKIRIIRNFSAGGGSTYRIKNENGEVVAQQVREIRNITTSLNIQVENPVCILNQDTSRNFLSSNDPKNKFKLFMRATKLETLSEEYKTIGLNKTEAIRLYESKQTSFNELSGELKELKIKIDNQKSVVSLRDRIKAMQNEMLWAKVRAAENEVKKEEDRVATWEEKHEKLLKETTNREERVKGIEERISALNQQMTELKDTLQIQSRPQLDVRNALNELKGKYIEKKREKQVLTTAVETKTRDAQTLKTDIENANENMSRVEQEKLQRLRHLTSLNDKIKGMEDHTQTCRNDLYQLSSDVTRRDEEKQSLQRDIAHLEHKISSARSSLNALKNESGNTLLLYGRDIPRIRELIQQNRHKFKEVPRGPLGSYIKLKDKKWALAVESHLTPGLLGSFTVDNKDDNLLLNRIINQAWSGGGSKPSIITSKFFAEKHDVRPNLVRSPSDCISLYDALEIEDPVVSNCIVDQSQMEGILLIPTNQRAIQLLSSAPHVPKNCRQGVTIQGDKYYPDPNYKTYGSRYHRAQYLQVDTKEHILQLQQNIEELTEKKETIQKQYSAMCQEMREQEAKKTQLEEKIRKLNAARSQIRRQIDELKSMAEPEVVSVDILESELTEIKKVLQQKTSQLSQVDLEIKEIKAEVRQNEEKMQKLRDANSSLEERMRLLEEQIREETTSRKEISTSEEFDRRKVKELEMRLNEARAQLTSKQSNVDKCTKQASILGERQETDRTEAEIETNIKKLELSVKKIEITTEDSEELLRKYNVLRTKFTNVSTILSSLKVDIDELRAAVANRERHYKLTETYFVTFIKHSFKKIMELRQFQGTIDINMNHKTLELIVIPQQGSQGLTTTANLSGGERSFSTVAFLYSLWQCMEFPFYFLDEFDVYMDKLNRTKVFEVLLYHAETHPELQFVFLTPQDVSFIKKDVMVLKLQDPERNQK